MNTLDLFLKRAAWFGSSVGGTATAISAVVVASQAIQVNDRLMRINQEGIKIEYSSTADNQTELPDDP